MANGFSLGDLGWEILVIVIGVPIGALVLIVWRRVRSFADRLNGKRVLVFVSTGGTCRDPMAKVITEQLWNGRKPAIEIHAVASGQPTSAHASKAARHVIKEMYGQDLLASHVPEQLSPDLAARATLILCMSPHHVATLNKTHPASKAKIHLLKAFFGLSGEIADPYGELDEMDADALRRYRACAEELRDILSRNVDHLAVALAA